MGQFEEPSVWGKTKNESIKASEPSKAPQTSLLHSSLQNALTEVFRKCSARNGLESAHLCGLQKLRINFIECEFTVTKIYG